MTVIKEPNGRWRAKLKNGRQYVGSKTFDTKKDAEAWLSREKAALAGGLDPKVGREPVHKILDEWLEVRKVTVSKKTWVADCALRRLTPQTYLRRQLKSIDERAVEAILVQLVREGLAENSVKRYRTSLSPFFEWCIRQRYLAHNPITAVPTPRVDEEPVEMAPFSEDELDEVHAILRTADPHLANIALVLGWTGLRWAEARVMTRGDFSLTPTAGLRVRRSQPEGSPMKQTKGRAFRRVPVADHVLPIVERLAHGRADDSLLFPASPGTEHQLFRSSTFIRRLRWDALARGRRIHDLRHTAACLWLTRGVDLKTVSTWLGHASITTTDRYLHYLGTMADTAGLERLNTMRGRTAPSRPDVTPPLAVSDTADADAGSP